MTEAEYRADPAFNYSLLAAFNDSQDHALMKIPPKTVFEQGKAFERLLQDRIQGTDYFHERYFDCDVEGDMPKDMPLWFENGDDLTKKYVYKDNGDRHGTYKTRHAYLDVCLKNPGKLPVGIKDRKMFGQMINNMLNCELFGTTVKEILTEAEWQVPIFWETNGIKKKALKDCQIKTPQKKITLDIKTAATIAQFLQMARKKYWIQDIHYTEDDGENAIPLVFLVAPKDEPWLAQPWMQDKESRQIAKIEYEALCDRFAKWDEAGRPAQGWKPMGYFKPYFRY